ncbi:PREDICTED: UTP:RNA uridylyltransferase 1 [Nelumbo nucifera]|uniref:RNA uridylyltransferase n=1 Tax=Nelumbo nucifera TaxID=4432 RepID=A0A1U8AWQ8_NELNU|nr:PREDICTED: UTP:RNA uridylyltransferase 1 [Nelumbo nucifera]
MTAGGGGASPPPPPTPISGGEFLLQLLQKSPQPQIPPSTPPNTSSSLTPPQSLPVDPHHPLDYLNDPAVAAMGPTLPSPPWPSNGRDLHPPWPNATNTPHPLNAHLPPFPQNPWAFPGFPPPGTDGLDYHRSSRYPGNHRLVAEELQRLGPFGNLGAGGNLLQLQQQQQESMLMFGSLACELRSHEGLSNGNSSQPPALGVDGVNLEAQFNIRKDQEGVLGSKTSYGSEFCSPSSVNSSRNWQFDSPQQRNPVLNEQGRVGTALGREQHPGPGFQRSVLPEPKRTPPGFPNKPKGTGQRGSFSGRRDFNHNVDKEAATQSEMNHAVFPSFDNDGMIRRQTPENTRLQDDASSTLGLHRQLDHPGPPSGSNLHTVSALDAEESLANLHAEVAQEGRLPPYPSRKERNKNEKGDRAYGRVSRREQDALAEELMDSLMLRDGLDNNNGVRQPRDRDIRSDILRGLRVPGQRIRNNRRVLEYHSDIERLNAPFLAIYESLIPTEEEKAKQKRLLTSLEKLVNKEWPSARLFLYGSCANSFGVSNSDIDVCLEIEDSDISKSEILLKLADMLHSDNLQNVQALTRARVPIVKLMDPDTGISCDICINNVLAVVNTKLLRDYAQIDARLRQLAFIVKHWAKKRRVNETYQGTLSSYAYVLMCIHFLQTRKPAILPCLQEMHATYTVTVDDIECAYFDRVEDLRDFGSRNIESIAQLVWAFFDYWAYRHDYANAVISVRTGSIISKRAKDWTRRIGNDRHLICIEDPFEVSHDLGRVVDKHSIKTLREEFERAAHIMQFDPDPCVKLFEPYVPSS